MTFITAMIFGPRRSSPCPALPRPAMGRPLFISDQEQDYGYKVTSPAPNPLEERDNQPAIIFNERAEISAEAVQHS